MRSGGGKSQNLPIKKRAAAFVRNFGLLPLLYGDRDVLVKYWNSSCLGFIASKALQVFM